MRILALDTTGRIASAALWQGDRLVDYGEKDSQMNHSRTLLPVVQQLLEKQGLSLDQMDVFAATVGPGSFTGVRIGVAAVKGYAWVTEKPCAPVSTLESAAFAAPEGEGTLCALVKARQDEFFFALFQGSGRERLTEDQVGKAGAIWQQLQAWPKPWRLTGDGAEEWLALVPEALGQTEQTHCRQNAAATAQCAARQAQEGKLVDCHTLKPAYLRPSQAERMRAQREGQAQEG